MDSNMELIRLHDRSIPSRRKQVEREEERTTNELIRLALQANSATAAAREAIDGQS